jgi:ubiquinone biosynthesis monooxygenase Coq7
MRRLPGDLPEKEDVARMIRVNHAGEYGAARIYAGQLAHLRSSNARSLVAQMQAQEKKHLETFQQLCHERRARPSLLMPFWHLGGYALGAATALMGDKAAFACTVAVESVIQEHYSAQKKRLSAREAELASVIDRFQAEEKEHHDTSLAQKAEEAPFYPLLSTAIKALSRAAIGLATRL